MQVGGYDGSNVTELGPLNDGTHVIADINDTNFDNTFVNAAGNVQGSWILKRTASNAETLYKNGTSVNTYTNTSSALVSVPIYILARNTNGTENQNSDQSVVIGYAFYGDGSINPANIKARLSTYLTAVGASGC